MQYRVKLQDVTADIDFISISDWLHNRPIVTNLDRIGLHDGDCLRAV